MFTPLHYIFPPLNVVIFSVDYFEVDGETSHSINVLKYIKIYVLKL